MVFFGFFLGWGILCFCFSQLVRVDNRSVPKSFRESRSQDIAAFLKKFSFVFDSISKENFVHFRN